MDFSVLKYICISLILQRLLIFPALGKGRDCELLHIQAQLKVLVKENEVPTEKNSMVARVFSLQR